jgi:hypothetical protein
MRSGASMMVHDPAAFTMGNSQEHAKSVEMLETTATSMADIYSEKTGRAAADIREEMKAETWMTAKEAVAKGYADKVDKARSKEPTAFDYRLYQHAPERMVALAQSRGWQHPGAKAEQSAANPGQHQETSMTEAEKAAADKAAADKIAADKVAVEAKAAADKAAAEATATKAAGDAVADAVKVERQRAADIHAACQMAGKPDKATAFISEGKSVSEVLTALQTERATASKDEVSTRHTKTEAPVALSKAVDRVNARFSNGRAA